MWQDSGGQGQGPMFDIDCAEEQKIEQSIALAYLFFVFFVCGLLPFLFFSGQVGIISGIWRQDLLLLVENQRERVAYARMAIKQAADLRGGSRREKYLRATVKEIDPQETGSVSFDDIFHPHIYRL